MNMAATMRNGSSVFRFKRSKGPRRGAVRSGERLRPGRAMAWAAALVVGLGFVAALSLALLVGFRWLTTSSYFSLSGIEVSGNRHLSAEEVVALTGAELGVNTLEMRISDIEDRLAANPWTDHVAVRRVLPDTLSIAITERVPTWWLRTGAGLCYAEADGSIIDGVAADRFVSLPQLIVSRGGDAALADLTGRMAAFDATGLPVRAAQAAWVGLKDGWAEMYFEGRDLWLSVSLDGWMENMKRLSLVWADLMRRGEDARAREIRIFGGKVWVRT